MTGALTLGERIAWYRRRRGLSQVVLAGLVDRTVDWLSKVENGRIELDRISVIRSIADALDVSIGDLLNEPSLVDWTPDSGRRTIPALRAALMDYRYLLSMTGAADGDRQPPSLDNLSANLDQVWAAYQDSRFGYVTHRVPALLADAQAAAAQASRFENHRRATSVLALTYHVAATTLSKVGEVDLAWIASDRGLVAAQETENPVVIGSLFRSVTHSLLATGRYAEAMHMTSDATSVLESGMVDPTRDMLSVFGTLLLGGSMAAARANDRTTVQEHLERASRLADRIGVDENRLWTAFGPTNVAIHRVASAMELGDVQVAIDLGPRVDTTAMPTERRVRHALEMARAYSALNRRDEALATLLEAERVAPEQIRYHYLSRHLAQALIRRERSAPSRELAGLADRLGVV